MKRVFVKPASSDLVVLDEIGRRIPADGREVNLSTFISRLIKGGDLNVSKPFKKKEGDK